MVFNLKYTAVANAAKTRISQSVAMILNAGIAQLRKSGFVRYCSAKRSVQSPKLSMSIKRAYDNAEKNAEEHLKADNNEERVQDLVLLEEKCSQQEEQG